MANDLSRFAMGIVVLGITAAVGATVLLNVRDTNTTDDAAYNLANDAAAGLGEYGNWFKILVIVAVAAVILFLINRSFGGGSGSL